MRRVFKAVSTAAAITSGVLTATSASAQVETRPPITAYKPAFARRSRSWAWRSRPRP